MDLNIILMNKVLLKQHMGNYQKKKKNIRKQKPTRKRVLKQNALNDKHKDSKPVTSEFIGLFPMHTLMLKEGLLWQPSFN